MPLHRLPMPLSHANVTGILSGLGQKPALPLALHSSQIQVNVLPGSAPNAEAWSDLLCCVPAQIQGPDYIGIQCTLYCKIWDCGHIFRYLTVLKLIWLSTWN